MFTLISENGGGSEEGSVKKHMRDSAEAKSLASFSPVKWCWIRLEVMRN